MPGPHALHSTQQRGIASFNVQREWLTAEAELEKSRLEGGASADLLRPDRLKHSLHLCSEASPYIVIALCPFVFAVQAFSPGEHKLE